MWSPTHIQVLVKRAKGLKIKGKDGTNDAFVTIGLGKEKYQTSVKEKANENVEWCEQCELGIPQQGNTAEVVLTALHRNFLGVDEFLGVVTLPLRDFDVYERPKTKWYPLKCKPGQNKSDYRGELEVRTSFTVKAVTQNANAEGSNLDLTNKKNKGSLQSLNKAASNFGGSLLSLGQKEKKNFKKFANTISNRVDKVGEKAKKNLSRVNLHIGEGSSGKKSDPDSEERDRVSVTLPNKFSIKELDKNRAPASSSSPNPFHKGSVIRKSKTLSRNRDPGVESDEEFEGELVDEDDMFRFDALSHRSSGSSLNVANNLGIVSKTSTPLSGSLENLAGGELLRKAFNNSSGTPNMNNSRRFNPSSPSPLVTSSSPAAKTSTSTTNQSQQDEPLDEWEQKLLGKKSTTPYISPPALSDKSRTETSALSQLSLHSGNGSHNSSRNNTLERQAPKTFPESLQKNTTIQEETPSGRKKIIPVNSDFESSPSPETPSSPVTPSPLKNNTTTTTEEEEDSSKKKAKFGLKWKRNLTDTGRTSSLFNLSHFTGKGFRDKEEPGPRVLMNNKSNNNNHSNNHRQSIESLNGPMSGSFGHTRNHSDGSGASSGSPTNSAPPAGPRVVLGRETTPTPQHQMQQQQQQGGPKRIPREIWERFEGKTREDLIETIVQLQTRIEEQARKQSDLEDYIDTLLMKVLSTAPCLLQKDAASLAEESFGVKLSPNIK